MNPPIIPVNMLDCTRNLTIDVRIHLHNVWRVNIGVWLIRVGAWVAGVNANVDVEGKDKS